MISSADILDKIITLLGVLFGLVGILLGYLSSQRNLRLQNIEDERKEIYTKLNEFYGPCKQLLATSNLLKDVLKLNKPKGWRTLTALLNGEEFSTNDKIIYEQIKSITDLIENLRIKNSGLIDDPDLSETLARAGAHFRIISAAYQGSLKGEVERFKDYVYPNKLNDMIDAKIISLQLRLNELNNLDKGKFAHRIKR
jgi:hypothetical protein